MKRRTFLNHSALLSSATILPGISFGQSDSNGSNPLAIPPQMEGQANGKARRYALNISAGSMEFIPGLNTPTIGVNGDFLGPTLRLRNGDDVLMQVRNSMQEPTTLHWHGMHVPAVADGGPHQVIEAEDTWSPEFTVQQNAGTLWYHSHLMNHTGEQVYRGLAGLIIIDDDDSGSLELPSEYGIDDIPLVIQDRDFNEDGSFRYVSSRMETMLGKFGNTILVNGTRDPYFTPGSSKVRFRLLNGSNARTYNIAFSDSRPFQQLACDGGFLGAPLEMRTIELGVGERCEIVADFSDGVPVDLISLPMANDSPFQPRGMMRNMHPVNHERLHILSIRPNSNLESRPSLPPSLAHVPDFQQLEVDRVRQFTLSMEMGMMGRGGAGGGRRRGGMGMMGRFAINGESMDLNVINERIPVGSQEIWELINDSMMMHPFHIHHGQFRVIDRNGVPVHQHERAYKDTVKVGPGERVRIVMEFEHFSNSDLPYMYHCHILEHEDAGMMGQFVVE